MIKPTMITLRQLGVMVLGVIAAGLMVWLGLWQASTFRTHGQEATQQRAQLPAVALPANATGDQVAGLYGRQVTITGQYLSDQQFYVGDKPPLRIVTAFRTSTGQIVPVVRGQLAEGATPPAAPAGTVTQTGLVMPSEKDFHGQMGASLPQPIMPTVKLERLAQVWPAPLLNGFVTLNAPDSQAQRLLPAQVELPEGEGSQRNAGYALQWWVFAAFALVMTSVWARLIGKPDREAKKAARMGIPRAG